MTEPIFDPETMQDVSTPISDLLRPAIVLSLGLFIISVTPYLLRWGLPASWNFGIGEILLALLGLVALVIAHEGVHALGWMIFGHVSPRDIRFGMDMKTLSPYAHARVPMRMAGYRIGAALPGIITGILPTVVGTLIGSGWLTFLGAFMVMGAVGDLLVLWAIRGVPGDARVLDHHSNAGCYVLK